MPKEHKQSKKLLLRPLTKGDISDEYVSWLNDPEITQFLGIRHRSQPLLATDIKKFLKICAQTHRFHWGIFVAGKHVGNVSCSEWSWDNRWIDISYVIGDKAFHGYGIATLAVGAAMQHLFTSHDFHRIQAHAVIDNIPSIRVLEKLKMKRDGILRQSAFSPELNCYKDEVIYSALRSEWSSAFKEIKTIEVLPMHWTKPSKLGS